MSKEHDSRDGHDLQRDTEKRARQGNRPPPIGRRFTPARRPGGYQGQQSQPSQRPRTSTPPGQRSADPSTNRRIEPQDLPGEDSEYEQFLRYQRLQRSRQNRQPEPTRRRASNPRSEDEEYAQFLRYQQQRRSAQQPGRSARQPTYIHDDEDDTYQRLPPRRTSGSARPSDQDDYDAERPARRSPTRSSTPTTASTRKPRPRRRVISTLFIGCAGGIITIAIIVAIIAILVLRVLPNSIPGFNIGTSTYTDKQQTLQLSITSTITQLSIQNPAGDLTVSTDPNATTGTLTYVKKTQATSQSNASAEFGRIAVSATPGSSTGCPAATCLAVTASVPSTVNDVVDMVITLPPQNPTPTFELSSISQKGTIKVQGFNGLLALTNDTGDITVKGGLLAAGSCLQSRMGNVTFAGTLETTIPPTINPCTTTPSSASNGQPWYTMKTGTGNVVVTLNTVSSTILLDASINNQGKIISDFPLAIKQNADGSSNYFGPLLPNTQPAALLTLTVDVSGNITLHKA